MPRVLGVDLGSARVGLALSDPAGLTAQPLEVLRTTEVDDVADAVADRVRELEADEVVVGIPIRMNGTRGPEAEAAEAFAQRLESRAGVPVHRWDERLSTKQAEGVMRSAGADARRQRGTVDKVAAAIVLQAYLESRR
jgi:putative pre-16S rRNA nuclease